MNEIKTERIGVYGGGFDPVHPAHLILAQTALEKLNLNRVIFMPSGGIAHYKDESNVASGTQRLEMLKLATHSDEQIEVSDFEISQNKFCYTIDTLRYLRQEYPQAEIILLVGSDWKDKIPTWKDGKQLLREFPVAIFARPGYNFKNESTCENHSDSVYYIEMPLIQISSSDLRERRRNRRSIRYLVPESVYHYIIKHDLYL